MVNRREMLDGLMAGIGLITLCHESRCLSPLLFMIGVDVHLTGNEEPQERLLLKTTRLPDS
jgi:hypothetical protein